jgi:hypothetical protein
MENERVSLRAKVASNLEPRFTEVEKQAHGFVGGFKVNQALRARINFLCRQHRAIRGAKRSLLTQGSTPVPGGV